MRLFLEISKPQTEEEVNQGVPPQELRYEVSSEEEGLQLLKQLAQIMDLTGWTARFHYCYHDEGKPCEVKPINLEEVLK